MFAIQRVCARFAGTSSSSFKSFRKVLEITTQKRMEFQNITPLVQNVVNESQVKDGMVLVNTMHTSSSVFVDDDDKGLHVDLEHFAHRIAPWDPVEAYKHNVNGEVNGAAHLQHVVFGREVVTAITDGKLDLGKWESIHYGEFDGQRTKKVLVKIIGH